MSLRVQSACWAHVGDVAVLHPRLQEVVSRHLVLALTHLGEACSGRQVMRVSGKGAIVQSEGWERLVDACTHTCCTVESGED